MFQGKVKHKLDFLKSEVETIYSRMDDLRKEKERLEKQLLILADYLGLDFTHEDLRGEIGYMGDGIQCRISKREVEKRKKRR